ncbi:AAA family ATPase [Cellulosimicrobium sp. ES-005]|uniref:AAA family ATPase n=1 Tax=Cellulosimicrobium sp. ES-005 TaxID=3163031 RepID=A0AAU8G127_9MICO
MYEIARELNIESAEILKYLTSIGEFARSASSTVADPVVRRIYQNYGASQESATEVSLTERPSVTPATTYTWQANPVKEPTREDVLRKVAKLESTFPEARAHKKMLQALGSQFVHAEMIRTPDGRESGFALARFSGAIEAAFGLTREVAFFYSPYHDLQIRSFVLAKDRIVKLKREVTPDLIFFSAPDERITVKLKDWSKLQFTAVPLPQNLGPEPIALISQLRDYIYARDLFYETTPVSGQNFFGRKTLLQELRDDIVNQRASGLFGLRKSGKTSILLKLAETLESEHLLPIFVDLETLPSPPVDPSPDFMREVASRISSALQSRDVDAGQLDAVASQPTVSSFKTALDRAVRQLSDKHVTLVLLLDEIEFLTPSDQVDTQEGEYPGVAQVLASLRAVAQSSDNFTFILSGLTNHILENGRLYGRPNPLFSWAKARYLGPFSRLEADELATGIGARMGIEIQEGALEALHDASGGHAYLYRNLASEVVATLPMDTYRRVMRKADVLHRLIPWQRGVAGNVEEMLNHLARYYPTESVLLEALKEYPRDFAEIARDEDRAIHHLISLGLIRENSGTFELSVLLELK